MKRLLVIGVGSIGERHLRCFGRTERADLSFVEIAEPLRRTIAERYPFAQPFATLDDALKAAPFDAAVICTPAHLHIPMALQLAERGVHLLIEKPLSISLTGVDRLQETITKNKLVAGVAYVLRGHPLLIAAKEAIASGRIGRPVQLVVTSGQHFPTYRPAYRQIYYTNRATGGGAIQDALTHMINAGQWLIGPIDRLIADAAHQVLEGVEVEDTAHVLARHGAVLANYSLNQYQAPNESTLTIVGDQGTLRVELHASRWRWMVEPGNTWHDKAIAPLERDDLFVRQAERFLDALDGAAPVDCTLAEGLATLQANLAALTSLETRSWEDL